MKRIASIVTILCATAPVFAFHMEFGFSGKSGWLDAMIRSGYLVSPVTDNPYRSWTNEVGQTAQSLLTASELPTVELSERCLTTNGRDTPIGVKLVWADRNDTTQIRIENISTGVGNVTVTLADAVRTGLIGLYHEQGIYFILNGVFTCFGNPYSAVVNETDKDRVINGVEIGSGDVAPLMFPVFLKTEEIANVQFYDLESGDELTATYKDGAYTLGWTGNILIRDGTVPQAPNEKLVFGDMEPANSNKVLFARNNMPIRSAVVTIATNIALMTWWDFDQSAWQSPYAKINDEIVCPGHSTSHIIDYEINQSNLVVNTITGIGSFDFTMSLDPRGSATDGVCTMRCWDAALGDSTSAFYSAPLNHRAEISAGLGVAKFKMTINTRTHEWSVEPEVGE